MKGVFAETTGGGTGSVNNNAAAVDPQAKSVLIRKPLQPKAAWVRWMSRDPQQKIMLWTLSLVIVAGLWQFIADVLIQDSLFFPSFSDIVVHAWQLYVTDHSIYGDFAQTMIEAGVGFGVSLAGVPLGLLIGLSKRVQTAMEPINSAMYALPHISLVPLAIVWFGLGITSKAFIVFVSAFFLIMINVTAGVATIGRELRDLPVTFGASRWRTFATVIVPGSIPFIFAALQLAIGRALVGVVAAELFASNKGLGYLLGVFGNNFETANLFVIIATFAVVGAILSVIVGVIGRRFDAWRIS